MKKPANSKVLPAFITQIAIGLFGITAMAQQPWQPREFPIGYWRVVFAVSGRDVVGD